MKKFSVKFKFILLLVLTVIILMLQKWQILLPLFVLSLISIYIYDKQNKILKKIFPLLIFGSIIVLFNIFFNYSLSYSARFILGMITALKIATLSLWAFVFTLTTSPKEIVSLFSFLPKRIQLILTITFSIIPIIIAEAHKIRIIQKARGLNFHPFKITKNILPVIIPLLHRSFLRAEQIAMVLYAKGYDNTAAT